MAEWQSPPVSTQAAVISSPAHGSVALQQHLGRGVGAFCCGVAAKGVLRRRLEPNKSVGGCRPVEYGGQSGLSRTGWLWPVGCPGLSCSAYAFCNKGGSTKKDWGHRA